MKAYLEPLVAVHDFSQGFKESLAEPGGRERLAGALADNPPVRHKVIQTHPETGKKVIFVNALFTSHIEGVSPLESQKCSIFCIGIVYYRSTPAASIGRSIVSSCGIIEAPAQTGQ